MVSGAQSAVSNGDGVGLAVQVSSRATPPGGGGGGRLGEGVSNPLSKPLLYRVSNLRGCRPKFVPIEMILPE